jgi:glutamate synthase domain-containing protein 2
MLKIANGTTFFLIVVLAAVALSVPAPLCYVIWGLLALLVGTVVRDLLNPLHSLGRAFPFAWRGRLIAEELRPEIQQYFVESNTSGKPASRKDRDFVYSAAKDDPTDTFFGSEKEYHAPGQMHIRHKGRGLPKWMPLKLEPYVIGPHRKNPAWVWGRFHPSDVSFGAVFERAKQSIATGAAQAGCIVSTGEGGLTPYDLNGVEVPPRKIDILGWWLKKNIVGLVWWPLRKLKRPVVRYLGGPDLMVEIGTGKFGFRKEDGSFDWDRYAAIMKYKRCVATKIKIHQGAKPGGGGHLPGKKVNKLIAKIRRIPEGEDCISPNVWEEFEDVPGMMEFGEKLADVSGKPWGPKIAIGDDEFIREIAKWMRDNPGRGPDFIHVDGGEGGTGAAPLMLADYVGMSIMDALPLVDNVLREFDVRDRVILISSGKIFNPAQLFFQLAMGADLCMGIRGGMFALGCIQAKQCGKNTCPTGITTNHWWLQRALVALEKWKRFGRYFLVMNWAFLPDLLRVVNVRDTYELNRSHLGKVTANGEKKMSELVPYPQGKDQPRKPPIASTYGLKAPSRPLGPTCMDAEMHALFSDFFDDDGRVEYNEPQPVQVTFTLNGKLDKSAPPNGSRPAVAPKPAKPAGAAATTQEVTQ